MLSADLYARVRTSCAHCTRDRGCSAHPVFPAPSPELDAVDKLVVEYSIAVNNNWSKTRDEIFARLREHFSEAQIVELTWRIALCGAFNRFTDILQCDIEQGVSAREAAE
jgi:alkylhydroperoxidase family enzyme